MWGQPKEESKNPFSGLVPQKKSSTSNLVQSVKVPPCLSCVPSLSAE